MSAYYILMQTVTDPQKFAQEYIAKVIPFLVKHGAEVIVSEFVATPLQGEPAQGAVVLRFPSEQAIKNWLDDPDYQAIKNIRLSLTRSAHAVMAPAFKMPAY